MSDPLLGVRVSRHVAYGASLLVAGIVYALLVFAGARFILDNAGRWSAAVCLVFVGLAAWLLVKLLATAAARRRLRVFISKHFYRNKYDYREEWRRFAQRMSTVGTQDVHAVSIEAIAAVLGSRQGLLFLFDESAEMLRVAAAWSADGMPLSRPPALEANSVMVRELLHTGWIIDTREYRETPGLYGEVALPDWLSHGNEWRIVVPVRRAGKLVGILVLGEPAAPFEMTYEDRDLLVTMSQHIGTHLAQYDADRKIAEIRQFEAFNQLTAFMMHDLKNAVAQLRLVASNATRHKHNPEFIDDAVATIANAVNRIDRLIQQLHFRNREAANRRVDVCEVARLAIERCSMRVPVPTLAEEGAASAVEADPDRLVSALEHAIRNAQDATRDTGTVRLRIESRDRRVALHVCDDGVGMSPEFVRERLFRPFDTTKGAAGMGIGAYQAREYARELGGNVEVQSAPGSGTRFTIILPAVQREPENG
jgi:putative PEP-CTERM system histidine kinase